MLTDTKHKEVFLRQMNKGTKNQAGPGPTSVLRGATRGPRLWVTPGGHTLKSSL